MTFNVGSVQGGTNAGWRRIKEHPAWTCRCGNDHKTYSTTCCSDRRPEEATDGN